MSKFNSYNADATKKAIEESEKKKGGQSFGPKQMKLESKKNAVLILNGINGSPICMTTNTYEIYKKIGGKSQFIMKVASPNFMGEPDPVMKRGFELRKKYMESSVAALKNIWKDYMPKQNTYVNVLDLNKDAEGKFTGLSEGPKVLRLPQSAHDLFVSELKDLSYDPSTLVDLDLGRPLIIEHNGAKGFERKYTAVKFNSKGLNLLSKGVVDEEKIIEGMTDLSTLQPEQSSEDMEKLMAYLEKNTDRIIRANGGSADEEEEGSSDDFEKVSDDDSEFSLDI